MERLSHNHADDTSELLSAYIDNALDLTERRRAEALAERCPACAQDIRELRLFKTLLQELPTVQPRRSFTLDPATAVGPRRLVFPTLRLATLVASLLLLVVLGADLANLGGVRSETTSATFSTKQAPPDAATRQFQFGQGGGAAESADQASAAASVAAPEAAAALAAPSEAAQPEASAAASAAAMAAPTVVAEAPAAAASPASNPMAATVPMTATGVVANSLPSTDAFDQAADAPAGSTGADQGAAGGAAPALEANPPLSPDTIGVATAPSDNYSAAPSTLRIIEIGLALIVLALASGAWWAWRQQR